MRLETLAKRLAKKTDTPVLEKIVLGEAPPTELPMGCMTWTGATLGNTDRRKGKQARDRSNMPVRYPVDHERPYGIMKWKGKRISVARLIFQIIFKPDYEFRMSNTCETPNCVNPIHFEVRKIERDIPPPPEPTPEPHMQNDGLLEEVEELVELLLTEHEPRSWDDVINSGFFDEDIPPDMIRTVLCNLNKEHLT